MHNPLTRTAGATPMPLSPGSPMSPTGRRALAVDSPPRRRPVVLVVLIVLLAVFVTVPIGGRRADAVVNADVVLTAGWVAAQIRPDGSVLSPNSGQPSVNYTMYALLGLAATGLHPEAQDRALGYVGLHVDDWVVSSSVFDGPLGVDLPGRLGYLIMAVVARGGNPSAFGTPTTDLVARLDALYGSVEPGVFGTQNDYSAVTDQSLAILGLAAAGTAVPTGAVDWLVAQQCTTGPATALGGWQAKRTPSGGGLADCDAPDPVNFMGADTNATAFALQALARVGRTAPFAAALDFLHAAQSPGGGFPWFTGGTPDPNSIGVVTQAIVAAGESPSSAAWTIGGATVFDALRSMTIPSGPDAGAMWFPTIPPSQNPDLLATYQGLWGLAQVPFPFPYIPVVPTPEDGTVPRFTG